MVLRNTRPSAIIKQNNTAQRGFIYEALDGKYVLRPACSESCVLDVAGSGTMLAEMHSCSGLTQSTVHIPGQMQPAICPRPVPYAAPRRVLLWDTTLLKVIAPSAAPSPTAWRATPLVPVRMAPRVWLCTRQSCASLILPRFICRTDKSRPTP